MPLPFLSCICFLWRPQQLLWRASRLRWTYEDHDLRMNLWAVTTMTCKGCYLLWSLKLQWVNQVTSSQTALYVNMMPFPSVALSFCVWICNISRELQNLRSLWIGILDHCEGISLVKCDNWSLWSWNVWILIVLIYGIVFVA